MTEVLEKAHKGDPGYEKWLAKYRAFRTAKAAKNDADKSEIAKEAEARRQSVLSGKASDEEANAQRAKEDAVAEARKKSADSEGRQEETAADDSAGHKDPDAEKLKDKRQLDETKKEIKSQKDSISAKKKAEVAKKFMDKLAAKRG